MYVLDNKHHNLPHIHSKHAEYEASIDIADGEILAGQLPRKQLRLVGAATWPNEQDIAPETLLEEMIPMEYDSACAMR